MLFRPAEFPRERLRRAFRPRRARIKFLAVGVPVCILAGGQPRSAVMITLQIEFPYIDPTDDEERTDFWASIIRAIEGIPRAPIMCRDFSVRIVSDPIPRGPRLDS